MNATALYKQYLNEAVNIMESQISDPFQKALIKTQIMNSLAILASNNKATKSKKNEIDEISIEAETTNTIENTTNENETVVENNETDNTAENISAETEAVTNLNYENISEINVDEDDPEWTERMLTKYAEQRDYVQQVIDASGKEAVDEFLAAATNNQYTDIETLPPEFFGTFYLVLKDELESQE